MSWEVFKSKRSGKVHLAKLYNNHTLQLWCRPDIWSSPEDYIPLEDGEPITCRICQYCPKEVSHDSTADSTAL